MKCRDIGQASTVGELRAALDEFSDETPLAVDYDSMIDAASIETQLLFGDDKGWRCPEFVDGVHEKDIKLVVVIR